MNDNHNLILIGMPGSGKSTVGILLAKALGMCFMDTDLMIQSRTGRLLQDIIDHDGLEAFLREEERTAIELHTQNCVVATGGSMVYSHTALEHLKHGGTTVYFKVPCDELRERLVNITTRGVAAPPGMSIEQLYAERAPLYQRYADITIDCAGMPIEATVSAVKTRLEKGWCND